MNKIHLVYLIPCSYGSVPLEFMTSVIGMQKYMGENYPCYQEFIFSRICYPDVAKNDLIETVKDVEDSAYLLFLDVDQIYPPQTPAQLIKSVQALGGIAQGFVRRRDNAEGMAFEFDDKLQGVKIPEERIAKESGVKRIGGAGFGGVLMTAGTIKKFTQPVMKDYYDDRGVHIGEDVAFFRECHNKDIPVWMDYDLKFPHLTTGAV